MNTLRSALRESCDISRPKGNFTELNLAKLDTNFSDTSPSQSPKSYRMDSGYKQNSHSKCFTFDESVMQKAKTRGSTIKKVKEMLKEEDRELLEMFEKFRHNIMNRSEWFVNTKAQKEVYSMLEEIEQKWIGPCMSSQLKLISCQKEQLKKELKQREDSP